jgi:hypothetical protein
VVEAAGPPEDPSSGGTIASDAGTSAAPPADPADPADPAEAFDPPTAAGTEAPGDRPTRPVPGPEGDDVTAGGASPESPKVKPPATEKSWPHREPAGTTDARPGAATAGGDTNAATDDDDADTGADVEDGEAIGAAARSGALGRDGFLRRKFEIDGRVLGLVLLVVVVAVGAYYLGHRGSKSNSASGTTATTKAPTDFTAFNDPATGTRLSFPKAWTRLPTTDSEADIRLALSAGGSDLVLLRVIPLQSEVTAANLGDLKAVTDAVVSGGKVQVLQQQQVEVNGLPGYYYLYTYTDAQNGQQGVHAHYFLFQGKKMNSIVFQAEPTSDFQRLATTFDQVANSFHSAPGDPPPGLAPAIPTTVGPGGTPATTVAPGGTPASTAAPSTAPPTTR